MMTPINAGLAATRTYQRQMYQFFGLRVESAFELPGAGVVAKRCDIPDVVFAWGDPDDPLRRPIGDAVSALRCYCPEHSGRPILQVFRHAGQTWIWHHKAGVCHVDPAGRLVQVFTDEDQELDRRILGLLLVGLVSSFVLHQRGNPCLHGSAVQLGDTVVAFLGPKGQGKSTMAAGLLRRGATLLSDDVIPLCESDTGIVGSPSLPIMKLWGQSVTHALELDDDLPSLTANLDKKLFTLDERFAFALNARRLGTFYVLDRYVPDSSRSADITIHALSPRDGVMALVTQTTLRPYLTAMEMAQLFPLYSRLQQQAPVRRVRLPDGFEHQDRVHDQILIDALGAKGAVLFARQPTSVSND